MVPKGFKAYQMLLVIMVAFLSTATEFATDSSAATAPSGSCVDEDRCGDPFDDAYSCQCDSGCQDYGDCCSDYEDCFTDSPTSNQPNEATAEMYLDWTDLIPLNATILNHVWAGDDPTFYASEFGKEIAMGEDGICIVVGEIDVSSISTETKSFYARSEDGCESWNGVFVFDPQELQPTDDFVASQPNIEHVRDGIFIVIWEAIDNSGSPQQRSVVAMRSTDNGLSWQYGEISAPVEHIQYRNSIASDHHGKVVVTWELREAQNFPPTYLKSAYSTDDGLTWEGQGRILASGTQEQTRLVASNSSTWILAFLEYEDTGTDAKLLRGTFSASNELEWSTEVKDLGIEYPQQHRLSIATDNNGNWVIVGARLGNDDIVDITRSTDDGHNWSQPVSMGTPSGATSDGLSLATNGRGTWIFACYAGSEAVLGISTEGNGQTWPDTADTVSFTESLTSVKLDTDRHGKWVMYTNFDQQNSNPAVSLLSIYLGPPTMAPTEFPTKSPTEVGDTQSPTPNPTEAPTQSPTTPTTLQPTQLPSASPTRSPKEPTMMPTLSPVANFFGWSEPEMLNETSALEKNAELPDDSFPRYPKAALSPSGTCLAAWTSVSDYKSHDGSSRYTLFYAISHDSCSTWGEYKLLDHLANNPAQAIEFDLLLLGENFVIAYLELDVSNYFKTYTSTDHGETWVKSFEAYTAAQIPPMGAGNGNFGVVVSSINSYSEPGADNQAYISTSDGGVTWNVEQAISDDISVKGVALSGTGTLLVVGYVKYEGDKLSPVFATRSFREGGEFELNDFYYEMKDTMGVDEPEDLVFVGKPVTDHNGIWIWPVSNYYNAFKNNDVAIARSIDDGLSWEIVKKYEYEETDEHGKIRFSQPYALTDEKGIWMVFFQDTSTDSLESTSVTTSIRNDASEWNDELTRVLGPYLRTTHFVTDQDGDWHAFFVANDDHLYVTHLFATKYPTTSPTRSPTTKPTPAPTKTPVVTGSSPSEESIVGISAGTVAGIAVAGASAFLVFTRISSRGRQLAAKKLLEKDKRNMLEKAKETSEPPIYVYVSFARTVKNRKIVQDLRDKLIERTPSVHILFVDSFHSYYAREYISLAIMESCVTVVLLDSSDYEMEMEKNKDDPSCMYEILQSGNDETSPKKPLVPVHLDKASENLWLNGKSKAREELGKISPTSLKFESLQEEPSHGQNTLFSQRNVSCTKVKELAARIQQVRNDEINSAINSAYGPTVQGLDAFLAHTWSLGANDEENNMVHKFVVELQVALKAKSIYCWLDDLFLKHELKPEMAEGIRISRVFVAFVSKSYIEKLQNKDSNAAFEFYYALNATNKPMVLVFVKADGNDNLVSLWYNFICNHLDAEKQTMLDERVTSMHVAIPLKQGETDIILKNGDVSRLEREIRSGITRADSESNYADTENGNAASNDNYTKVGNDGNDIESSGSVEMVSSQPQHTA